MPIVNDYTALLSEYYYNYVPGAFGAPIFITYTFLDSGNLPTLAEYEPYSNSGYTAFSSAQKTSFRSAISSIEQIAGVQFIEVDDPDKATVSVMNTSGSVFGGWANYADSGENYATNGYLVIDETGSYSPGTNGYEIILHELGHVLGLKHPFDGDVTLSSAYDNDDYTLMSYTSNGQYDTSLATFDIQALNHYYGAASAISADWSWSWNEISDHFTLNGGSNADRLLSVDAESEVNGYGGEDYLLGRDFDDVLNGGDGDDFLVGGDGDDTLNGGNDNDTLVGGYGNNTLNGNDGDDLFIFGYGTDTVNGGSGTDTIDTSFSGFSSYVQLNNHTSVEKVISGSYNDTLVGTSANEEFWDGAGDDYVSAGGGDDRITSGGGEDSYHGGQGIDWIGYFSSPEGVTLDLENDTASGSWADDDSISGFENAIGSNLGKDVIHGTSGANHIITHGGNDKVYAGAGSDHVELGAGNDYVLAGGGNDIYDGGLGKDWISYQNSTSGVTLNLGNNTATGGLATGNSINSFESASGSQTGNDVIYGTAGANHIKTYGGNDRVYAGGGTDRIELGAGNDYVQAGGGIENFDGGTGSDWISYYNSSHGVTLDLENNTASGSWAVNDTINSFENVSGSKTGNDVIYGTAGVNHIITHGGNDRVYAGGGTDRVELGAGNDYVQAGGGIENFDGGTGSDWISYYNSSHGVTLDLENNTASGSWAVNDTINSFENVSGSKTGNDVIYGTAGVNHIITHGGNDRVYAGGGTDRVELGAGNDYVQAGGGIENFDGGTGSDWISYYNSSHGVTLDLENNTASGSWAVNDTINSFENVSGSKTGNDVIYGTAGVNHIVTHGGNDKVYAGAGSDRVELGAGNDYVRAGGGNDIYDGGSGKDWISYFNSSSGVTLDLENNTASGGLATGNTVIDFESVSGSENGNDVIYGTSGSNYIKTFGGNDVLEGFAGNDILDGGIGDDEFRFSGNWDNDIIRGFDVADDDVLNFVALGISQSDLTIQYGAQDTVISYGTNTITIEDSTDILLTDDFLF